MELPDSLWLKVAAPARSKRIDLYDADSGYVRFRSGHGFRRIGPDNAAGKRTSRRDIRFIGSHHVRLPVPPEILRERYSDRGDKGLDTTISDR